jgi:hypothetical protein
MESVMQSLLEIYKYFSVRRLSLALLIVNVIGAIVYIRVASPSWAIPEERAQGIHTVTGEPFVWAARALPIFAGFSLLNFLWGAYICVKRSWLNGYLWLTTAIIWLVAVWVDFAHH